MDKMQRNTMEIISMTNYHIWPPSDLMWTLPNVAAKNCSSFSETTAVTMYYIYKYQQNNQDSKIASKHY